MSDEPAFRLRLRDDCADGRVRVSVVGEGENRTDAAVDAREELDAIVPAVEQVVSWTGADGE